MGRIYHIFNRGVEKRLTFIDKKDLERFLQTLDYYRFKDLSLRFSFRKRSNLTRKKVIPSPMVEVLCFCLMPNHFHFLLKQLQEKGISSYLSKITNSYTKYFNSRYNRLGPLFQGTFKAVKIEDNELTLISRHIHLNPILHHITKNLKKFTFSSYPEYLGLEDGFCQKKEIMDNFKSSQDYEKFVLDQEDYESSIKKVEKLLMEDLVF